MKKVSLKGTSLGSLKRATIILKFLSHGYWKHVNPCRDKWVGRESCLDNLQYFQNLKINYDFFAEHCDISFQTSEKSLQYHTCTTHMQKLLTCNRNGYVYLMQPKPVSHMFSSTFLYYTNSYCTQEATNESFLYAWDP